MNYYLEKFEKAFLILNEYLDTIGSEHLTFIYKINEILDRYNINRNEDLDNIINDLFKKMDIDEFNDYKNEESLYILKLSVHKNEIIMLIKKLYNYLLNCERKEKRKERKKRTEELEKIEKERLELEKELEKLEINEEFLLESERLKKDQLIKELEFKNKQLQEQLEKENELEKINRAIDRLQVPCDELKKSQDKFKENRDNFDKYAMDMFKVATVIFVFMTFYLSFFTEINDVSKSVSIGYYLSHSFPILFPTIIGFLFIRQSNVNSKELDKINRRFILIHEVGQSLRALTEINDEKQMNEKTQRIIDKLIGNILNYASENNGITKNEESNILELNERLDKLIDTIDKKLTVIGKSE